MSPPQGECRKYCQFANHLAWLNSASIPRQSIQPVALQNIATHCKARGRTTVFSRDRGPSSVSPDIEIGPGHYNRLVDRAVQIKIDVKLDVDVIKNGYKNTGATVTDQQLTR